MLSPEDQTAVLNAHNEWRQRYNYPPLMWDNDLAAFAQDWADQMTNSGNFDHRPDNSYGENISMGTAGVNSAQKVVDSWGDEVNDYWVCNYNPAVNMAGQTPLE